MTVYLCGWCDQFICKGMRCGSIYDRGSCYWTNRVAEVGVRQAIREGKQRAASPGQFISDPPIPQDSESGRKPTPRSPDR
jgi:hypothetical protein